MRAMITMMGLLLAVALGGCAAGLSGSSNCGKDSSAHGLVSAQEGATSCIRNADCNLSPKPACAAPSDNTCLCTKKNASDRCMAGQCVWHVDPANTLCVCVGGQVQRCELAGGATGIQQCNAAGTAWGACS